MRVVVKHGASICIILFFLSGCTGLKFVPKGELLYTGAKVEIIEAQKIKGKGAVKSSVKKIIRPAPNTSILGMRPQLWVYEVMHPKKEKGLKQWIKKKLGEPPVFLSAVDAVLVTRGIDAGLYNSGFFNSYSQSSVQLDKRGKSASLVYKIYLNQPYTIGDVIFPAASDSLNKLIDKSAKKTLLKNGSRYSLETLVAERSRIDAYLKNKGYYYFRPDYILFKMDTNSSNHTVRLQVTLKPSIPDKARVVYYIADVNVYPDYRLGDSTGTEKLVIDSINYFKGSNYIRPKAVLNSVFYKPGQRYSSKTQQLTLSRLNGLGVFKFINVVLHDKDTLTNDSLSADIYLTALPRNALSAEVDGSTKSDNFTGPALILSLKNRNVFKGAELMIYNLSTSFDAQYSGQFKGQFTYNINPKVILDVPRIIAPVRIKTDDLYVPHTQFSVGYDYLSRVGYFDMNTVNLSYGFKWKPNRVIDEQFLPVSIVFYNIYHTSPLWNQLLVDNPLIANEFMEQFIPASEYTFTFNQQVLKDLRNQFYFKGDAQIAGNLFALLSWLNNHRHLNSDNPSKVLGVSFAQFVRFDFDVRHYFHITPKTNFVVRMEAGWGIPYGNSSALPYAREFFSGGAYSLRGFQANAVGPGRYVAPDSLNNIFYQQQGGEIKLEFNVEYRFTIYKILKGAVFSDAGNTWLNKPYAETPGGEFQANSFIQEMALDAGAGLRLDLDFFVLRLDIGVPFRNPAMPTGQEWVIQNTRPSSLVFNLAFGYPF